MPVTVYIPGPLTAFTEGNRKVLIDGSVETVEKALDALWSRYPGVRSRVLTDHGEVREHINIFVGEESIRYTGGLASRVPDGGEIYILPAISGGTDQACGKENSMLQILGTVAQLVGTVLVTLPIWGKALGKAWAFDTMHGMHVDEKGRWPIYVLIGLLLLVGGYAIELWVMVNSASVARV